jgi:hypothetical protein
MESLNHKFFRDLTEQQQEKILDSPIRSIVIDAGANTALRYEVFAEFHRALTSLGPSLSDDVGTYFENSFGIQCRIRSLASAAVVEYALESRDRNMSNFWHEERSRRDLMVLVLILSTTLFALVPQMLPQGPPSGLGDVKDAAKAYASLKSLANEAVSFDPKLGHSRVSISNGIVVYDFAAAQRAEVVSRPDRLTTALEVMIRAGVLDRDFRACLPAQIFWVAPLDHIQNLAEKMVDAAYAAGSETERQSAEQAYNAQVQAEFAALEKELLLYAHNAGIVVRGSRGSVEGYKTDVRVDPPQARVRFMSFLTYRKCVVFKLDFNDYWLDLTPGSHLLIGKYHYLAEWPASLSGPVEANFDVDREGETVTFSPLPKRN